VNSRFCDLVLLEMRVISKLLAGTLSCTTACIGTATFSSNVEPERFQLTDTSPRGVGTTPFAQTKSAGKGSTRISANPALVGFTPSTSVERSELGALDQA
jgi:hypothetical protein